MAERLTLQEFQAQLAARLESASGAGSPQSKLGFIAGGRHWLIDLTQVNEVVTVKQLTPVPWVQPWFVGMASVRGALFGCTDFALYQGLPGATGKGEQHLLLAHPRFGVNAALRIERALGLRSAEQMEAVHKADDAAAWIKQHWRDSAGGEWTEISMEKLVGSPHFLAVGI